MWVSLSVTRTGAALYSFLSTVTVDTVPGLAWISMVPRERERDAGRDEPAGHRRTRGADDRPEPISRTWPSSMPQPIW